jgi:hypothetical protein
MAIDAFKTICKTAILGLAGLLLVTPLFPALFAPAQIAAGAVILASALPCMRGSYKKPVYFFLALSALLFWQFSLPPAALAAGVKAMLPIVAIVAVLQVFIIPLTVGRYDRFLRQCLRERFRSAGSLYMFLHVLTHLLGALLSLGSVPLVFSVFQGSIRNAVADYKRFIATAEARGFALSTVWAPGAASVMLAMQATGAQWIGIFAATSCLAVLGLVTSALMEKKLLTGGNGGQAAAEEPAGDGETGSVGALLGAAAAMIVLIAGMEKTNVLTNSTRILAACLIVACVWIARYCRRPGLKEAWLGFWGKALDGMPGLAALFIAMGIFSEAADRSGLLTALLTGLDLGASGRYLLFLVPPCLLLISCTGVHPFVSLMVLGKILTAALVIPHQDILISFALLLGGALSYVASPFTGTVIILASLTGSTPAEVAFKWNGPFAAVLLLEGLAILVFLQWLL